MKRLFACIAACALFASLALAGCGSNTPASSSAASPQGSSSAAAASQQADQSGELIETKATITDADGNTTSYTVQIPAADATALAVLEATRCRSRHREQPVRHVHHRHQRHHGPRAIRAGSTRSTASRSWKPSTSAPWQPVIPWSSPSSRCSARACAPMPSRHIILR